jgi:hypothetical protein
MVYLSSPPFWMPRCLHMNLSQLQSSRCLGVLTRHRTTYQESLYQAISAMIELPLRHVAKVHPTNLRSSGT